MGGYYLHTSTASVPPVCVIFLRSSIAAVLSKSRNQNGVFVSRIKTKVPEKFKIVLSSLYKQTGESFQTQVFWVCH